MKTVVILLTLTALTACETVKGAGRDMQGAGHAITKEADKVQQDL
ncbi:entericidin A/B family lipoprotein [Pseudogemmobacter bohemicus]|nr:entericidin A/B family lipoprotein [Pseudogemmobacter bohemicus]